MVDTRSYDACVDIPKTGWDEMSIERALKAGKQLYVNQDKEVWTADKLEYFGKIL